MQTTIKAKITGAPDTIGKEGAERPNPALDRVDITYECQVEWPDNLDGAIAKWGGEVCFSRLIGAVTIDLQSAMRAHVKSEEFSTTGLQTIVDNFVPGLKKAGVSASQRVEDHLTSMGDDELEALIAKVKAAQADNASANA